MNIVELAKQAGVAIQVHRGQAGGPWDSSHIITPDLERFAALVRAEVLEEAAGVCELRSHRNDDMGAICAAAIRALKEQT